MAGFVGFGWVHDGERVWCRHFDDGGWSECEFTPELRAVLPEATGDLTYVGASLAPPEVVRVLGADRSRVPGEEVNHRVTMDYGTDGVTHWRRWWCSCGAGGVGWPAGHGETR